MSAASTDGATTTRGIVARCTRVDEKGVNRTSLLGRRVLCRVVLCKIVHCASIDAVCKAPLELYRVLAGYSQCRPMSTLATRPLLLFLSFSSFLPLFIHVELQSLAIAIPVPASPLAGSELCCAVVCVPCGPSSPGTCRVVCVFRRQVTLLCLLPVNPIKSITRRLCPLEPNRLGLAARFTMARLPNTRLWSTI